ncbi:MAG: SMP-30/gluconolactonase/LRE family protein [Actinobacteria bacterium]|nr:SMP-30/gluconolactonase/LRE family protein [Actinomycetota bacterium]
MAISVRSISPDRSDCGEGPIWNPATKVVSWVDIYGSKWHQNSLEKGSISKTFVVPTIIGAIVERASGGYLAAVKEGFAFLDTNENYSCVMDFLPKDQRMNDAKVDSKGRFWAGSTAIDFTPGRGQLHLLRPDMSMRVMETGLTLPNGLGWSPDNTSFYLVDSMEKMMWRYDFDEFSGEISNRKLMVRFPDDGALPDGLTVTDEGLIIVAMWDGSRLEVFSPDGARLTTIPMPVKRPSSCTFADDKLIVTSAGGEQDLEQYPLSGLTLVVEGLPYRGQASAVFNG